jgi:hypothetical protein
MTAHATNDSESFQNLLANAFAVQESGINTELLSAIVTLQHSIVTGELDVDKAMHLIGEHARNVANATGVAIGLLKGDQLVYRAGSGSAAPYIGQHVVATLCVSAHNAASGEILRVENAQIDSRIEAAICRQFGAESLLILPIYGDRAVVGVLEVLFDQAHSFDHREVLSYRLLADLVGEAMSQAIQPEQKHVLAADLLTMQQSIGQIRPRVQKSLNAGGFNPAPTTNHAICKACGTRIPETTNLLARKQPPWPTSKQSKYVSFAKGQWKTAAAAVLVIVSWIVYKEHRTTTTGTSALQAPNAIEQATPTASAKQVSASSTSNAQTGAITRDGKKAARTPHWVRVSNNELDYVAQDVTVRHFTTNLAPQPLQDKNSQVRYISEDVTVRYFTPKHAAAAPHPVGNIAQPADR